ncbi:MAG: hypothetical protein KAR21_15835, partial [Spirochaetales bacterium]|nr:hypothetical protein [Spirochaetales bacterium]
MTSYNLEDFEHSFKGNRDDYMGITFSPDMGIAVMGYKNKRMLGLLSCDIDQQSVYKKIEYDEFKKLKNFAYAYKSIEIPRNGRVPLKNGVSIFTDIVRTDFFSGDKYYTTIHTPDNKEYHI